MLLFARSEPVVRDAFGGGHRGMSLAVRARMRTSLWAPSRSITLVLLSALSVVATAQEASADPCNTQQCGYQLITYGPYVYPGYHGSCLDYPGHFELGAYRQSFSCDGEPLSAQVHVGSSCFLPWMDPADYGFPQEGISSSSCDSAICQQPPTCEEDPGTLICDGIGDDVACGDDEHACKQNDSDPYPARFSTGHVELEPLVAFDATPDGIEGLRFDYVLRYETGAGYLPAHGTGNALPAIRYTAEDTHFTGLGFADNYSDRILERGGQYVWVSSRSIVYFHPEANGVYRSRGGKFLLSDLGAGASPRFRVDVASQEAENTRWFFTPMTIGSGETIHVLSRKTARSSPSGGGGYSLDVQRASDGRIHKVVDSLGRELRFSHELFNGFYRVSSVSFAPSATAPATRVVSLDVDLDGRLSLVEMGQQYRRYRYDDTQVEGCATCAALVTEVIGNALPGPVQFVGPARPHEQVLEGHVYDISEAGPRVVHTYGPTREYHYVRTAEGVRQLDLHQPEMNEGAIVTCETGCGESAACYSTDEGGDDNCYVASEFVVDPELDLVTTIRRPGGASGPATSTQGHSPGRAPTVFTDPDGVRTTYAYNENGDVACMVRNDDDESAADDPENPAASCAAPASGDGQVSITLYEPGSITRSRPSLLASGDTTTVELFDDRGRRTDVSVTGATEDIDGAVEVEEHLTHFDYDSLGRQIRVDGPLPDPEYDVEERTYWSAPGTLDHGRLRSVTRYLTPEQGFTTKYGDYDVNGVPRTIRTESSVTTLSTTDGLTWTQTVTGADGTTQVSTLVLNPDGTRRAEVDADGWCTTTDYRADDVILAAPTRIRRSHTLDGDCGVVPIDPQVGDVEVRTYAYGEPDRPLGVELLHDGQSTGGAGAPTYDDARHMVSTPEGATLTYDQTTAVGLAQPGGPADGSIAIGQGFDVLGRLATTDRALGDGGIQRTTFEYASPYHALPSRVVRGAATSDGSETVYVYDDFGRLLETQVPEQGTTRFAYDAASRMIASRAGVGTRDESTTSYRYDALGRLTYVDQDADGAVGCGDAADGTPVGDVEYVYDACTGPLPEGADCSNGGERLVMTRSISHCEGGAEHADAHWYGYDGLGRLATATQGVVVGGSAQDPITTWTTWSPGGRLLRVDLSLHKALSTALDYDGSFQLRGLSAGSGSAIVTESTWLPTGAVSGYTTGAQVPVEAIHGSTSAPVRFDADHDEALRLTGQRFHATAPGADVTLFHEELNYGPGGLLTDRRDGLADKQSRHYRYDAVQRLVCELVGTSDEGECVPGSSAAVAVHGYFDGDDAWSPANARSFSYLAGATSDEPLYDAYAYENGSATPLSIGSSENSFRLEHDARGRRTSDWVEGQPETYRQYTYLPNGQIGRIDGAFEHGAVVVRYGADGLPIHVEDDERRIDLVYSAGGRLIGARLEDRAGVSRWGYHYLGGRLVAATRVSDPPLGHYPAPPIVDRFWFISDERGLVRKVIDERGETVWGAIWDANGARRVVEDSRDVWVPFGLAGQIVLDGTGLSGPPLALNHMRVYDPRTGAFLTPDALDVTMRQEPEAYVAARANPVSFADPSGNDTHRNGNWIDPPTPFTGCSWQNVHALITAHVQAVLTMGQCTTGSCRSEQFRRAILEELTRSDLVYECARYSGEFDGAHYIFDRGVLVWRVFHRGQWIEVRETEAQTSPIHPHTLIGPKALHHSCLSAVLAHEATHPALHAGGVRWLEAQTPGGLFARVSQRWTGSMPDNEQAWEEDEIDAVIRACYNRDCKQELR